MWSPFFGHARALARAASSDVQVEIAKCRTLYIRSILRGFCWSS
jgi:hypothetical protein